MTQRLHWRNHIAAERVARGLSREQLAERSGLYAPLEVEFDPRPDDACFAWARP